jgi:hypothetical protein
VGASLSVEAWNNFVMASVPSNYQSGSKKRAAAIANRYWGLANNGGINYFLTCSYDFDATEVLESLILVGALEAAKQFNRVIQELKVPILASSQDARWSLLERHWPQSMDAHDVLSHDADRDLLRALNLHVQAYEDFYLALKLEE